MHASSHPPTHAAAPTTLYRPRLLEISIPVRQTRSRVFHHVGPSLSRNCSSELSYLYPLLVAPTQVFWIPYRRTFGPLELFRLVPTRLATMSSERRSRNVDAPEITQPPSRAPSPPPRTRAPSPGAGERAPPPLRREVKKQPPQKGIDEFWDKFTTKAPGKAFTILPDNLYAKRAAAHAPKGATPGQNAVKSYDQAAEACRAKVNKIVNECRRINQKYRDPHFDIEADFKRSLRFSSTPDCLCGLDQIRTDLKPLSVKRVEVYLHCFLSLLVHCSWSTGHIREAPVLHRRRNGQRRTARQRWRLLVHVRAVHIEQQGRSDPESMRCTGRTGWRLWLRLSPR